MRLAVVLISFLAVGVIYRQLRGQDDIKSDRRIQVEFYVAGTRQPPTKYRVKRFRRAGADSPELAGLFRGLRAQDLEQGEYEYALEPEVPPAGPPGSYILTGKVQLYGAFPHWITLQMPTGVIADLELDWIEGRIVPAPIAGRDPVWIRFQHAVDQSLFFQMKLGGNGSFRLPRGAFEGSVIVSVCRGDSVLFLEAIQFTAGRPDRPLELRLKPDSIR